MTKSSGAWAGGVLMVSCVLAGAGARAQPEPAAGAWARSEAAMVASVHGVVEVRRGRTGAWQPVLVGAPLFLADGVRTGSGGAAKLLFRDDSVVDLAAETQMAIDQLTFEPTARQHSSLLHLDRGKLRALVSEYYGAPRARYEIETPSAAAAVHGAEFVVLYEPVEGYTEVVGIEREVEVRGTIGVIGPGVKVGPGQMTRVEAGRFPSPPRGVERERLEQYRAGLETVGTGSREGFDAGHALVVGRVLQPEDRPERIEAGPEAPVPGPAEPAYLDPGAPAGTLGERLSADRRAHTEPLLEYRAAPPGEPPTGSVRVDL